MPPQASRCGNTCNFFIQLYSAVLATYRVTERSQLFHTNRRSVRDRGSTTTLPQRALKVIAQQINLRFGSLVTVGLRGLSVNGLLVVVLCWSSSFTLNLVVVCFAPNTGELMASEMAWITSILSLRTGARFTNF
jgi:hypothetical protein